MDKSKKPKGEINPRLRQVHGKGFEKTAATELSFYIGIGEEFARRYPPMKKPLPF